MNISAQILEIETSLKRAGKSVDAFCVEAAINRTTWTRWKYAKTLPNMATWQRVSERAAPYIEAAA